MFNIKFLRSFGFLIFPLFLLFSGPSYADVREELKTSKSCGLYENSGVVRLFSWEICEQDFTYRMFFKLMPTIMEDYAVPLTQATNIKNISSLEADKFESYKINEYSIINITKSIISISLTFGSFIFVWNAFLAFVRTSTDGKFLGDGYTWQKNLIKYGLILVMLLPIGNGLIVINLLVVVFILFAIAFGNAVFSVYLNFFDVSEEAVNVSTSYDDISVLFKDDEESREMLARMVSTDHNYFAASQYVEGLYRMQVCKVNTESFILDSSLLKLQKLKRENKTKYSQFLNCISRPHNPTLYSIVQSSSKSGMGYLNNSGFLNVSTDLSNIKFSGGESNNSKMGLINGIEFGYNRNSISDSCREFEEIQSYSCGKISVSPITVDDNKVGKLLNKTNFSSEYIKATAAVEEMSNSYSISDIEKRVMDIWKTYERKIVKELGIKTENGYDLSAHDETVIKTVSYLFHQQLLNDVYTGRLLLSGGNIISPSKGDGSFYNRNVKISDLAESLVDLKCNTDLSISNSASSFLKQIVDGKTTESDYEKSAYCTYIESGEIYTRFDHKDVKEISDNEAFINELEVENSKRADINLLINNGLKKEILKVYTDITAIERSFFKSMRGLKTNTLTSEMRKLGFAASGSLGLKLIKSSDIDSKFLSAIRSSVGFDFDMSDKFIGREEMSEMLNLESPNDKILFPALTNEFDDSLLFIKSQRLDLRQTNLRSMTQNLISQSQSSSLSAEDPLSTLLNMMSNPLGSFKKALGYETGVDINIDTMRSCMADMDKCPIPVENPIIAITDFGNELVTTGAGLIATTVTVVFADFIAKKSKALRKKYRKKGSVSNKANNAIGTALGGDGLMGKAASTASSLLGIASTILKMLFPLFIVMLAMGMFFAYIIPLIPFLMFQFSYIAWITMALTVYFISPIWLVMNLKLEQDGNVSNNMYRSGYNMAMQVIFRPAILVLAMSIGWGLFNAVFLILNITIMPYILGVVEVGSGDFLISHFVNSLMIIVVYAIIAVILIKYVFNLTYSLINKIFDAMNVENINDQKGNITDDVMKSALISSLIGSKGLGSLSNYLGQVSANADSSLKPTIEDKIDDALDNAEYRSGSSNSIDYSQNNSSEKSSKGRDGGSNTMNSLSGSGDGFKNTAETAANKASDNIENDVKSDNDKDKE